MKEFWIGPAFSEIYKDWEIPFLGMENLPLIIGLSGPTKTGKTIVAKQLATGYGFQYISLSSPLDKLAHSYGIVDGHWRQIGEIAIELRREFGNDVLARLALAEIVRNTKKGDRFVVDSIFHPSEVIYFKKLNRFTLIWLDVKLELRVRVARNWYKDLSDISTELQMRDIFEQLSENRNSGPEPNLFLCYEMSNEIVTIRRKEGFNEQTVFEQFDELIQKYIHGI